MSRVSLSATCFDISRYVPSSGLLCLTVTEWPIRFGSDGSIDWGPGGDGGESDGPFAMNRLQY